MAEPQEPPLPPREDGLAAATGLLALAGSFVMIAAALLVTLSVLRRWFFNEEIQGTFEIVQIGTALTVFAFLPYCQARRGNVMVDTFTARLPERVRNAIDALWDLVYAAAAGLIAWGLATGARETIASGTTSMVLQLPTGYAIAACAVMAAILGLVALLTGLRLIAKGRR